MSTQVVSNFAQKVKDDEPRQQGPAGALEDHELDQVVGGVLSTSLTLSAERTAVKTFTDIVGGTTLADQAQAVLSPTPVVGPPGGAILSAAINGHPGI